MELVNGTTLASQFQGMVRLPVFRQVGLLVGIALAVAIGVALVLWTQDPVYRVVSPDLPSRYRAQLMTALQSANIPYKLDSDSGAVMVPVGDMERARMHVSQGDIPQSHEAGYELLEVDPGFGTSQRMETAKFQRVLEGELTRSIRSLRSVDQARVHLALPERSVFVREQKKASASVVLQLVPGRRLDDSRIMGIQELVASSVPELMPEDVAVLDDQGRLLSHADEGPSTAISGQHLAITRELERTYQERIERLLQPMFGHDGVRAQVTAAVDFSMIETTSENFNPENEAALVRSEQIMENSNSNGALGVPGALTNQPPDEAITELRGTQEQAEQRPGRGTSRDSSSSRDITRNYELDRRIERVQSAPGQIQRLSVAVLVDTALRASAMPASKDKGKKSKDEAVIEAPKSEPLSEERRAAIEALVREAVGFDADRGDSIMVTGTDFQRETFEIDELEGEPFWEKAWLWEVLKKLTGVGLLAILLFSVFRPTMRTLATPGIPSLTAPAQAAAVADGTEGEQRTFQDPAQARLSYAQSVAENDPKRVAQVTRAWIHGDD